MLPREDFSMYVNVEVALVISTGTSLRMIDGTNDRAEKHDLGCLAGYVFGIPANTEAAQKLIVCGGFRSQRQGVGNAGA